MFVVRYRTHGPWQTEHEDDFGKAVLLAEKLAESYTDVVLDSHDELGKWRNGEAIGGIKK